MRTFVFAGFGALSVASYGHTSLAAIASAEKWSAEDTTQMLPEDPAHPEKTDVKNFPAAVQLFTTDQTTISAATNGINCSGTLFAISDRIHLYTAAHCFFMVGNKEPRRARLTHWKNGVRETSPDFDISWADVRADSFKARRQSHVWKGPVDYDHWDDNAHDVLFPGSTITDTPSDFADVSLPESAGVARWALPAPRIAHATTGTEGTPETLLIIAGGCDQPAACYTPGASYHVKFGHFVALERVAMNKVRAVPAVSNLTRPGDSGGAVFSADDLGVFNGIVSAGKGDSTLVSEPFGG